MIFPSATKEPAEFTDGCVYMYVCVCICMCVYIYMCVYINICVKQDKTWPYLL